MRNTTAQTNPATNFKCSTPSSSVCTTLAACFTWTSMCTGQHANTTLCTQNTTSNAASSHSAQYDINSSWPGADYYAFYSNYLQSVAVPQPNSYVNVPVCNNPLSLPSGVQTDVSQPVAYTDTAAAYYNAFYASAGYSDQMYSYLFSYNNTKPT